MLKWTMTTSNINIIRKAIFPIAGLGSRFLPATKASPKEMLPVVDKPLIQYAVEEAYDAGIRQMIFVTGRTKRAIEDHFDTAYELEVELEAAGKKELLAVVQSIKPHDMQCVFVRQHRALGLGHAVLCAEQLIGQEPFAVLLADDLMVGNPPIMAQMVAQFKELRTNIVAVENVPRDQTLHYGIVTGVEIDSRLMNINGIVEKPAPELAQSTLAVAGRYILTPSIFTEISSQLCDATGEIQLTDSIASLLRREKVYAYRFHGTRYDCGSKLGYLKATVDLAESHTVVGTEFKKWLNNRSEVGVV